MSSTVPGISFRSGAKLAIFAVVGSIAAAIVGKLVDKLPPAQVAGLDEWVREIVNIAPKLLPAEAGQAIEVS